MIHRASKTKHSLTYITVSWRCIVPKIDTSIMVDIFYKFFGKRLEIRYTNIIFIMTCQEIKKTFQYVTWNSDMIFDWLVDDNKLYIVFNLELATIHGISWYSSVRYKLIFIATLYSSSPASAKLKTSHKRFARSAIEKFYRQREKEREREKIKHNKKIARIIKIEASMKHKVSQCRFLSMSNKTRNKLYHTYVLGLKQVLEHSPSLRTIINTIITDLIYI